MTRTARLRHEFVGGIPDTLADGTLYISIDYATAAHKCCCGCGREVVTPLSPTDWKFTFDGVSISLYPSIGNWNFPCRSHYWIDASQVVWADQWSDEMVAAGRARDHFAKANYYAGQRSVAQKSPLGAGQTAAARPLGLASQLVEVASVPALVGMGLQASSATLATKNGLIFPPPAAAAGPSCCRSRPSAAPGGNDSLA